MENEERAKQDLFRQEGDLRQEFQRKSQEFQKEGFYHTFDKWRLLTVIMNLQDGKEAARDMV